MPLTIERRPTHILVRGDGLLSLLEAQQHFRDMSAALVEERREYPNKGVRVLVDLRAGSPQTQPVNEHIERAMRAIYRDDDRVALLVKSTLLKMQIQRIHTRDGSGVFVSQVAAEEFLFREA